MSFSKEFKAKYLEEATQVNKFIFRDYAWETNSSYFRLTIF